MAFSMSMCYRARPLATLGATTDFGISFRLVGSLPNDRTIGGNFQPSSRENLAPPAPHYTPPQHQPRRNFSSVSNNPLAVIPPKVQAPRHQPRRNFSSVSNNSPVAVIPPKIQSTYYVPRAERSATNTVFQYDPIFKDRLVKRDRTCPTRELNYTAEHWLRHKDPWRRVRHLGSLFSSSPFRRLLIPDLTLTASVGALLSYYNVLIAPEAPLLMDGSAMAGATTAIGLLAAFRLNASYGRWDEARKFWGEINNSSRDLAGNAAMWIESSEQRQRMFRLGKAFPFALLFHLNDKGGHYLLSRKDPEFNNRKYAELYAEMSDIFQDKNDPDFVQICNTYFTGGHVPLTISAIMRTIIAHNDADPMYNREMDEQVQRLVGRLGMCERLLRTPIPTCFTRHTSRLFFFWSNLLPLAMYSSLGPIGVIPGSLLVSYSVLGIGDIGVQLEEPFNILPLRQYSDVIHDGINTIEGAYNTAEKRIETVGANASTGSMLDQTTTPFHDLQQKLNGRMAQN